MATTHSSRSKSSGAGGETNDAAGASDARGQFSQKEIIALTLAMPQQAQLQDASWLIPRLVQLCQSHAQRAVTIYRAALDANLDLTAVKEMDRDSLLVALITAMIRMSLVDEATKILRDLQGRGIYPSNGLVTSTA